MSHADVVVVGAGVSGLSCARTLTAAGKRVVVLERARGVGGRCATRNVEGQQVDHGVAYLHGTLPAFVSQLRAASDQRDEGWPLRVEGQGSACQPRAFALNEVRVSYAEGVKTFPRWLARDLDVRLETTVTWLEVNASHVVVHTEQAGQAVAFEARDVVLALAGPQSIALLDTLPPSQPRDAVTALLKMLPSLACLTVIAVYPPNRAPPWQVLFPEASRTLQLVSHDSSKRAHPQHTVLVMQARPAWSHAHLRDDPAQWAQAMLNEAAHVIGDWAGKPESMQAHRWSYARVGPESELAGPPVLDVNGGCRVGIAGEQCAPGGGVQAAWQSGVLLAQRLLSEVPA